MNNKKDFEAKQMLVEEYPKVLNEIQVALNKCEDGRNIYNALFNKFKRLYNSTLKQKRTFPELNMTPAEFDRLSDLERATKYVIKKVEMSDNDKAILKELCAYINSALKRYANIKYN